MSENQINVTEEQQTDSTATLVESIRRILLAGVGVLALAQEEIESFLEKLVDRGEIADKDARQIMSDVIDGQKKFVSDTTKRASLPSLNVDVDGRVEGILKRLNLPTRTEVNSLSQQISDLSSKIDEIAKNE